MHVLFFHSSLRNIFVRLVFWMRSELAIQKDREKIDDTTSRTENLLEIYQTLWKLVHSGLILLSDFIFTFTFLTLQLFFCYTFHTYCFILVISLFILDYFFRLSSSRHFTVSHTFLMIFGTVYVVSELKDIGLNGLRQLNTVRACRDIYS